ncbi:MAG: CDP-alcohol phosphatidyltransferase family protein [Anaerolineae bacterium]|jgi:CDP-diacylglycerol--glycerol-3-phosphate 3-phosphatidyltransferase
MTNGIPGFDADRRAGLATLTEWLRPRAERVLSPVARLLGRLGIHPNAITVVGFLFQVGVGLLFYLGRVRLGGLLLFIVAPLDALDGAVARVTERDGPFGAFLDSTLDRLSDAVLIMGLAAHEYRRGELLLAALLIGALVAALMVSYTRARAESLGVSCKVGLLTRLERVTLAAVMSALGLTAWLAWVLALLSAVTLVQRVAHVHRVFSRRE